MGRREAAVDKNMNLSMVGGRGEGGAAINKKHAAINKSTNLSMVGAVLGWGEAP